MGKNIDWLLVKKQQDAVQECDVHDLLKLELFEHLLPQVLYNATEEEHKICLKELAMEKEKVVYGLFERMCQEYSVECPYKEDDFALDSINEGGLEFVIVSIPESTSRMNAILRVYIISASERENPDKIYTRYLYIKKFAEKGSVHVMYVSPSDESILGDELINHMDDIAFERRTVARTFLIALLNELQSGQDIEADGI